ncbi:ABC transporter ATP-binding protein [Marivivens niveibacter]|uniref:ABC transporter ATP-binding protein n=1 Tax=Marivivens niveibacter TaxID=1930667 RepID=A0A251WZN6_9RHOB|nr:ABC transporter ATP-binding protein [Marivivens niveibacter]OUD09796.1 ABC transporter ATP-binding protein [Marivivens niveibacter]
MLSVRDLRKSYALGGQTLQILQGVSFDLAAGETLALTGESGSGKSTILHLVGGLDRPDAGQVVIDGRDIGAMSDKQQAQLRRTTLGIVFQQFNLIPSLTVADNIAFQARLARRHDPSYAADLASEMGLADQLTKYPEQLSGGQQQRVAIARSLAAKPKIILADEPTGNLDETSADAVMAVMNQLVRETGTAMLMVTHSEKIAHAMDRRLHLSHGQVA